MPTIPGYSTSSVQRPVSLIPDPKELDLDVQFHLQRLLTRPIYVRFVDPWKNVLTDWPFLFDRCYMFCTFESIRSALAAWVTFQFTTPESIATRLQDYIANCITSLPCAQGMDMDKSSFVALYYLSQTVIGVLNGSFDIRRVLLYFKALYGVLKTLRGRSPSDVTSLGQAWCQFLAQLTAYLLNSDCINLEILELMATSPELIYQPHCQIANLCVLLYFLKLYAAKKLELSSNSPLRLLLRTFIRHVSDRIRTTPTPSCSCLNMILPPDCDDYRTHFKHRRTLFLVLLAQLVSARMEEADPGASWSKIESAALGIWQLGENYMYESKCQDIAQCCLSISGRLLNRNSHPQGMFSQHHGLTDDIQRT